MHILEEQLDYLSEITNYLLLTSAGSLAQGNHTDITNIISVMPNPPRVSQEINRLIIPIQDSEREDIRLYFEEAFNFINKARNTNSKILIHCEKGISRSASFVIAWLLMEQHNQGKKVNYEETLEYVKCRRAIVSPNRGFTKQLKEYTDSLNQKLIENYNPIQKLPNETRNIIFGYLPPQDLSRLGSVSKFFHEKTAENAVWKHHLTKLINLKENDLNFISQRQFSFKNFYIISTEIQKKWLSNVNLSHLIGYIGDSSAAKSLINDSIIKQEVISDLLFGATINSRVDFIKELMKHEIDIFTRDKRKQNILFYASAANNLPLLRYLYSINPNLELWRARNSQGDNLLFMAAYYGCLEAFKFLYETIKLNPLEKNLAGENLLFKLINCKNSQLALYIKNNISGLDPQQKNNSNISAHTLAVRKQNVNMIEIYNRWEARDITSNIASLSI